MLQVMDCGKLFQTAVLHDKTLFQPTQVLPDVAVGDCSRWIESGVTGQETALIETYSSVLVLFAL